MSFGGREPRASRGFGPLVCPGRLTSPGLQAGFPFGLLEGLACPFPDLIQVLRTTLVSLRKIAPLPSLITIPSFHRRHLVPFPAFRHTRKQGTRRHGVPARHGLACARPVNARCSVTNSAFVVPWRKKPVTSFAETSAGAVDYQSFAFLPILEMNGRITIINQPRDPDPRLGKRRAGLATLLPRCKQAQIYHCASWNASSSRPPGT